jgi:hypothetical protein
VEVDSDGNGRCNSALQFKEMKHQKEYECSSLQSGRQC